MIGHINEHGLERTYFVHKSYKKGVFLQKEKFGFLAWLGSCLLNCEHSSSDLINAAFYASPSSQNDDEMRTIVCWNRISCSI